MSFNILSIDSNDVASELDRVAYKKMSFHVIPASGFSEAEQVLSRMKVDVITINLDVTSYDSVGLIQYFKNNPQTKTIPIVAASVQTGLIRRQALSAGVDLFIEQPIPRHYYIEKVKKLLEQKTRTTDRVRLSSQAIIQKGNKKNQVEIVDLSPSGALLEHTEKIEEVLELSLLLPGYKRPIQVSAKVVREIAASADDSAKIAVKFERISSEAKRKIEKFVLANQRDGELKFYL